MAKTKYRKRESGEPWVFNPQKKVWRIACCDCGLVHLVRVKVSHRQNVTLYFWREQGCTGQLRRHGYGAILGKKK